MAMTLVRAAFLGAARLHDVAVAIRLRRRAGGVLLAAAAAFVAFHLVVTAPLAGHRTPCVTAAGEWDEIAGPTSRAYRAMLGRHLVAHRVNHGFYLGRMRVTPWDRFMADPERLDAPTRAALVDMYDWRQVTLVVPDPPLAAEMSCDTARLLMTVR